MRADKQAVRVAWVEALRSGRYRQSRGALRKSLSTTEDQWCCLGVLCDIVDPSGWGDNKKHLGRSRYPAPSVLDAAGERNGQLLTMMNDQGTSFQRIADLIDKEAGWAVDRRSPTAELSRLLLTGRVGRATMR